METVHVESKKLAGTPYEIGRALGQQMVADPKFVMQQHTQERFTEQQVSEMMLLFDTWCPGLKEELRGFSEVCGITAESLVYCAVTYLIAGCSQIAILPSRSEDGHVYLARNTDFSHHFEEFTLCKTMVSGKYAHIGTSIALFGRGEGINECGLAVSQTSCGIPVGCGIAGLKAPAVTGLQYWAVIRVLLENCKDVEECLQLLKEMPIAYHLNLMLADSTGTAVLFEAIDGIKGYRRINHESQQQYLHSTNHAVFSEVCTPYIMKHSAVRYHRMDEVMRKTEKISLDGIKKLCTTQYPEGLHCPWYDDFLGTTKSLIFDVNERCAHLCWGGAATNGWTRYSFDEFFIRAESIPIQSRTPDPEVFAMIEMSSLYGEHEQRSLE